MELFSQRNLIKSKILHPKDMPEGLRNRIWNEIEKTIDNPWVDKNNIIEKIWSDFFKKKISKLRGVTSFK